MRKRKLFISLALILSMVCTFFPCGIIQVEAAAVPTFNLYVMGKDGEKPAWSETWYFKKPTDKLTSMDADLTSNPDGTGSSFPLIQNFTAYQGFEDDGCLLYCGIRSTSTGDVPVWACCKRGILIEELVDYVEDKSGFSYLRSGKLQATATDTKLYPFSLIPYEDYYWGDGDRYYFPGFYESGGDPSYFNAQNAVKVPAVLAMVGYYKNEYESTLTKTVLKDSADTKYSLRLFFGVKDSKDIAMAGGTAQNVQDMVFYPEYRSIELAGGSMTGSQGAAECRLENSVAVIKSRDNWFTAAKGEAVTLSIEPLNEADELYVYMVGAESGTYIELSRSGSEYSFTMPGEAVVIKALRSTAAEYNIEWYTDAPDARSYSIGTEEELLGLAALVNGMAFGKDAKPIAQCGFSGKTIELTADIELLAAWQPIGSDEYPFEGTFTGNGHTIGSMKINNEADLSGLFGVNNGTIQDLRIEAILNGGNYTGAIAGCNNGTILRCAFSSGLAEGKSSVGGIAGKNTGRIELCSSYGAVSGTENIGGICGSNHGSLIRCISKGQTGDAATRISGGICGTGDADSFIDSCLSVGKIIPGVSAYNPVSGYSSGSAQNNVSFDTLEASSGDTRLTGERVSAEKLRSEDFVEELGAAYKANGGCFPVLTWENAEGHKRENVRVIVDAETGESVESFECPVCGGEFSHVIGNGECDTSDMELESEKWDGYSIDVSWYFSEENSRFYIIDTAAKLAGAAAIVNGLVNSNCKVYTGQLTFTAAEWNNSDYVNNSSGSKGGSNKSSSDYSYGVDDFNGKTLQIVADLDMSKGNYMPLGGQYLMDSEDENSKISASFCGMLDGGGCSITIKCSRHSSRNYGDGQAVGLIGRLGVHDNDPASSRPKGAGVCNVAVYGKVYANRSVGGVVGKIGKTDGGATISGCANFADISGTDSQGTGGICGAAFNGGTIRNCYNSGRVENYGGPCGGIAGVSEIELSNCYNAGVISGGDNASAISNDNGGAEFTNCYWLAGTSKTGALKDGEEQAQQLKEDELSSAQVIEMLGEAFEGDRRNLNKGRPVLKWQNGTLTGNTYYIPVPSNSTEDGDRVLVNLEPSTVNGILKAAERVKAAGLKVAAESDNWDYQSTTFSFSSQSAEEIAKAGLNLAFISPEGYRAEFSSNALFKLSKDELSWELYKSFSAALGMPYEEPDKRISVEIKELRPADIFETVCKAYGYQADQVLLSSAAGLSLNVRIEPNSRAWTGEYIIDIPVSEEKYTPGEKYIVIRSFADWTETLSGTCIKKDGEIYIELISAYTGSFTVLNVPLSPMEKIA